jgi:DNA polymerase I
MSLATVDFETDAIVHNPVWKAPAPAGVAIYREGHEPVYITERDEMRAALLPIWDGPMLFHNAPFDISVATQHLDLPWPKDPLKIHDTMYLLFLLDPYARTYSLKPSAERYLNLPPDERDAVRDWVLANIPGATAKGWGAHIAKAPISLLAPYAKGDVTRTRQLFNVLHEKVLAAGMEEAYQREQKLMPIMTEASRRGIPLDRERLGNDVDMYEYGLGRSTNQIFKLLGTEFNIDSDRELATALDAAGAVDQWVLTDSGAKSVARKNLVLRPEFQQLKELLDYRGMLNTCLGTFIYPWLNLSEEDGNLHPEWNQTRSDRNGTRTGRLSCSNPNFQNVPNASEITVPKGLPPLPQMRKYVLPPPGHVWLKRDFSAQEMRIMAHFAEGSLFDAYQKDPNVDPHAMVQQMIKELLNLDLPRKHVKVTGFGIMYGMGVQKLADSLDIPYEQGYTTKEAYFAALPEVKKLAAAVKSRGSSGEFIKTWGGRRIFKEPHPDRNLSYKLLNLLIQGSAADQTKQSIVDWNDMRNPTDLFMATVHDENNIAAPIEDKAPAMNRLRRSMDADRFSVPFRSEGFAGPNWEDIEEYEA